ncbi:MAG: MoxR family ATPase [Caldilineaceae bacterium]
MLLRYERQDPLVDLQPVADAADIVDLQGRVRAIHVNEDVRNYALAVVRATREHPSVALGVSPRGTLALYRAGQAYAALHGRDFVIPSDIQRLAPPILTHRIHISPQTRLRGRTPQQVVAEVVESVPAPVAE